VSRVPDRYVCNEGDCTRAGSEETLRGHYNASPDHPNWSAVAEDYPDAFEVCGLETEGQQADGGTSGGPEPQGSTGETTEDDPGDHPESGDGRQTEGAAEAPAEGGEEAGSTGPSGAGPLPVGWTTLALLVVVAVVLAVALSGSSSPEAATATDEADAGASDAGDEPEPEPVWGKDT
jgi:hypothetical protein